MDAKRSSPPVRRFHCRRAGRSPRLTVLPGGLIFETNGWRVEHCVGPLGVGTLVVKPKRHVVHVADLTDAEALEMGPLLRQTANAVRDLTDAVQVYVCLWSHGPAHVHYVVQPAIRETIAELGVHGPRMQAAMFARGGPVDAGDAAAFAERAKAWFSGRRQPRSPA